MKIAIIVREETADRCIGKGCLDAFYQRKDAFEAYDSDTELIAFTHHGGDLEHKLERLKENGVDTVHLSTCMRAKCDEYETLAYELSKDFNVIGYTHGPKQGKTKDSICLPCELLQIK